MTWVTNCVNCWNYHIEKGSRPSWEFKLRNHLLPVIELVCFLIKVVFKDRINQWNQQSAEEVSEQIINKSVNTIFKMRWTCPYCRIAENCINIFYPTFFVVLLWVITIIQNEILEVVADICDNLNGYTHKLLFRSQNKKSFENRIQHLIK